MELINGRYRVNKVIGNNQLFSSYLVTDLIKDNVKLELNIFNEDNLNEELFAFFTEEYLPLTSIKNKRIIQLNGFGIVDSFDGKALKVKKYFYSREYLADAVSLLEYDGVIEDDKKIDIFMKTCQAITYLHLKGYSYGELNLNNIYIRKVSGEYEVVLKDIATIEVEKHMPWLQKRAQFQFKAPEVVFGNKPNNESDIYSLGILFVLMNFINKKPDLSFKNLLNQIKSDEQVDLYNVDDNSRGKVIEIIERMSNQYLDKRYTHVIEIINDINTTLNTLYKPFYKDELEGISNKYKLIGRDREVKKVLETYDLNEKGKQLGNIIFLHGEHGIGKSRFLKELVYLFSMKKLEIFQNIYGRNSQTNNEKPISELIKQLLAKADGDIMERYSSELAKIIPGLSYEPGNDVMMHFNSEKEKFYIYSRVLSFIQECIKNKPVAFILDNVHEMDNETMELLEYLLTNTENHRMIVIIGYSDRDDNDGSKIISMFRRVKSFKKVQDIVLGNLNIEETANVIKNMLSLPNLPIRLATKIYSETYGNPLFIEEVIKNLYAEGYISIDEKDGTWSVKIDDYDKIPLPSNIYQAVLNQIRNLDSLSMDILDTISIFDTSVSANVISEVLSMNEATIQTNLETLIKKGILDKKVEDWGYAYDLHNRGVKKYIYDELDSEERKRKHKIAAEFLERQYALESRENKEELIYHLEQAGETQKAIEYCIDTANNMRNMLFKNEAIIKYEKAVSLYGENAKDRKMVDILLAIADIYKEFGETDKAVEYYNRMNAISNEIKYTEKCVVALTRICEVHALKNDLEEATRYLELANEVMWDLDYPEGYLYCRLCEVRILFVKQKLDEIIKISFDSIKYSNGKYLDFEGKFYNQIGIVYLEVSKYEEAFEMFKKCADIFKQVNNPRGMALAFNNIGVILGDFYQKPLESISMYNKMNDIAEKHNIIDLQITASGNLAECFYDLEEFEKAYSYHLHSLELSLKIGFEPEIFSEYINLCKSALKLHLFREANDYFEKATHELEEYPTQRKGFISEYYRVGGELFFAFGDMNRAKEFAEKAYEFYKNDEFISKWFTEVLLEYINIYQTKDLKEIQKGIDTVREINKKFASDTERLNVFYTLGYISRGIGNLELSKELIEEGNKIAGTFNIDSIRVKNLYANSLLKEDTEKVSDLEEALELVKKTNLRRYDIYINNALGNYYFEHKEYYNAIKYYFESCEMIKKIALQIPDKYRVGYMVNLKYLYPFTKLMEINRIYDSKQEGLPHELGIAEKLTLEILDDLFEYKDFLGILTNKHFIRAAEKKYENVMVKDIKNTNDLVNCLTGNTIKDLDMIVKFAAKITLSTRAYVIINNENQEMSIAAALDNSIDIPNIKFAIERVNFTNEPLFISESIAKDSNEDMELLPEGIRSAICIPIINIARKEEATRNDERRKAFSKQEHVMGYLYLDSDRILNNFNNHVFQHACQLVGIVRMLIDNYKLKIIASIDKLTGVFTRKYFEDMLKEELDKARAEEGKFALIMFDIDKFKNINDKYGHQKGDMVLREICSIVSKNIRKEDVCGRYGGEEFIIILPNGDENIAGDVAEKLRAKVDEAKILGDKHAVTMSLGVAVYPEHGDTEQELIEKVDQALYVAKESGRNRVQVWNAQISNKVKRKDRLAGIVSGNMVQDNRNVLAMLEIIELIKQDINKEDKIYKLLGRIIEISEAQNGIFFIVNDGEIANKYGRKKFEEKWIDMKRFNKEILSTVIAEKQGVYRVDWDDMSGYDTLTGTPDWQSVIVVPLIKAQEVRGVLYLSVSTRVKEFDFNMFNFVSTLGDITAALL